MPKTKTKKEKDPNAPRRFRNAYFIWAADNRALLKTQHPDWNGSTMVSELSSQWKSLDDKSKEKYKERSAAEKAKYDVELAAYKQAKGPDAQGSSPKKSKSKK